MLKTTYFPTVLASLNHWWSGACAKQEEEAVEIGINVHQAQFSLIARASRAAIQ